MTHDESIEDFEQHEARRQALAAKLRERAKAQLFDTLHAQRITHVRVGFDGQGDEGQIENPTALGPDGRAIQLPADRLMIQTAKGDGSGSKQTLLPVPELIEDLCYEILGDKHLGWQDGEGAFGEFLFNVADRTLTLTFNQRFSDYDISTETY